MFNQSISETIKFQMTSNQAELPFVLMPGELTLEDIRHLLMNATKIKLTEETFSKVGQSYQLMKSLLNNGLSLKEMYQHFFHCFKNKVPKDDKAFHYLKSYELGMGDSLDKEVIKLTLLLKINSPSQGFSGISKGVLFYLIDFYNYQIYPKIPKKGASGVLGDANLLSYLGLCLMGKGHVYYQGKLTTAASALAAIGRLPLQLEEKDALSILCGNEISLASTLISVIHAQMNYSLATISSCFSLDALKGGIHPFHPSLSKLKNDQGQFIYSHAIFKLLEGSENLSAFDKSKITYPYSIMCQPQIMGSIWQNIKEVAQAIISEVNGVSDCLILLPDTNEFILSGNFHQENIVLNINKLVENSLHLGVLVHKKISFFKKHLNTKYDDDLFDE